MMKSISYEFVCFLNYWHACLVDFLILVQDDTCEMNREGKCFNYVLLHNKPLQHLVAEKPQPFIIDSVSWIGSF